MTVEISAMQHEDMVTKLEAAWQSGDVPDIYMERGGGELADPLVAELGGGGRHPVAGGRRHVAAAVERLGA